MNFFMMLDLSDPADQLAWLAHQLELSEDAGEVSIITIIAIIITIIEMLCM